MDTLGARHTRSTSATSSRSTTGRGLPERQLAGRERPRPCGDAGRVDRVSAASGRPQRRRQQPAAARRPAHPAAACRARQAARGRARATRPRDPRLERAEDGRRSGPLRDRQVRPQGRRGRQPVGRPPRAHPAQGVPLGSARDQAAPPPRQPPVAARPARDRHRRPQGRWRSPRRTRRATGSRSTNGRSGGTRNWPGRGARRNPLGARAPGEPSWPTRSSPAPSSRGRRCILHQKLNFVGKINRQYDDRFANSGAKIGSSLLIRLPNQYTVRTGAVMDVQGTPRRTAPR